MYAGVGQWVSGSGFRAVEVSLCRPVGVGWCRAVDVGWCRAVGLR